MRRFIRKVRGDVDGQRNARPSTENDPSSSIQSGNSKGTQLTNATTVATVQRNIQLICRGNDNHEKASETDKLIVDDLLKCGIT